MAAPKSSQGSVAKPEYKRTAREAAAVKKIQGESAERSPRLKVSQSLEMVPDHPDETAGFALLMEAVGTTDPDFFLGLVDQLAKADGGKIDEHQLNFMLSVVKGFKPREQIEAMLAAQMAAVHSATMKLFPHLAKAEYLPQRDSAERTLNKLMRTFVTQVEALKRYRTGGEQTVTVQQVNVSEGGQAIVGNVTQGQRDATPNGARVLHPWPLATIKSRRCPSLKARRGLKFQYRLICRKNDCRSSTQHRADAFEPAMRRQDPIWQAVTVAGRPREKTLSHARRGSGIGGSARQQKCAEAWTLYP